MRFFAFFEKKSLYWVLFFNKLQVVLHKHAPVAQLDRAFDYESKGLGFESLRVRHFPYNFVFILTRCMALVFVILSDAVFWIEIFRYSS